MLVLASNNIGIMWVGMEATTLLSAFLISLYPNRLSLEAMWKYLIICSIGIAFAFMGTLLAAASIQSGGTVQADALFWTHLASADAHLDPTLMKFAFVFVLVGYGAKAGLAPMHLEITKLLGRLHFRHSYSQNILDHSVEVAHLMGLMAAELGLEVAPAKRAGLLHELHPTYLTRSEQVTRHPKLPAQRPEALSADGAIAQDGRFGQQQYPWLCGSPDHCH